MTTTIRDLFDNERPIDRRIEKVINYETVDSDLLQREIAEYVATDNLQDHLDKLLDFLERGMGDGSREVGVWVSGFYGSGKSSFTKYLGFSFDPDCTLNGRRFSEWFGDRFERQPLCQRLKTATTKFPTKVIMLDLAGEQLAGTQMADVATVLYHKVMQLAGYSQDAKIAELERMLEADGKMDGFRQRIREIGKGKEWDDVRNQLMVANTWAARLAPEFYPDLWPTQNDFKSVAIDSRKTETERVKEMLDLIRRKWGRENIMFVIDEVGQYVASRDELILKLQGFAEILKNTGKGKAWVFATAQQTLTEDDEKARFNSAKLFKLKDRFPISIDIPATDIRTICYRRLLTKSAKGRKKLEKLYDDHGQSLRHATTLDDSDQTRFYKGDLDKETFQQLYPFLPHHFSVLMELLGQLARTSGGIGLRSAIKVIQDILIDRDGTGGACLADGDIGRLATADVIYDVLRKDIERSFRHVVQAVDKVAKGYPGTMELRVAKAVAVLQILDAFPLTRANLAALMHPAVAAVSQAAEVNKAVETLIADAAVPLSEIDGRLRFMSEAVSELDRKRRDLTPATRDLTRIVNGALRDLFSPLPKANLKGSLKVTSGLSVLVGGRIQCLEGERNTIQTVVELAGSGEFDKVRQERIDESRDRANENKIALIGIRSDRIEDVAADIFRCSQIYETNRNRTGNKEADDYLEGQRQRAESLKTDLDAALRQALLQGTFIFRGMPRTVSELGATELPRAADKQMQEAAESVFHKYGEAPVQVDGNVAEKFLRTDKIDTVTAKYDPLGLVRKGKNPINTAHPALVSIHDHLDRSGLVDGRKLLDHFSSAPYGWSKDTTRYLVAAMFTAGELSLRIGGATVTVRGDAAITALRGNNEFNKIGISLRSAKVDRDDLLRAAERLEKLTGEQVSPLEEEISKVVTRYFPDLQQGCAQLPLLLKNRSLAGVERAEEVRENLAEILKGDASDAGARLGGKESTLHDDLKWAGELKKAFDNRLGEDIDAAQALIRSIESLPDAGLPAEFRNETATLRDEIATLLAREDFHEHHADLRTKVEQLKGDCARFATQLADELCEEIARRRTRIQDAPAWQSLTPGEQADLVNRMDKLQPPAAEGGMAAVQRILNSRYELDDVFRRIADEVRKLAEASKIRETGEFPGNGGSGPITKGLPSVVRTVEDLNHLIATLQGLRDCVAAGRPVHIILDDTRR
jgi:hypothetical protein